MTQSERLPEDVVRDETGLSGPGEDRAGDTGAASAQSSELLAPERIGQVSRPYGHLCFIQTGHGNVTKGRHAERQCRQRGRENL
jgi:hypothetical protein